MMTLELIPIGTVLALLANQVTKTAKAVKDVLVEKESFKVLSKYLSDIEPVLKELQHHELNDSDAARAALDFLKEEVKKAQYLVEKYNNRASFYLLIKCRHIVKEVQQVTRDIGRSLDALCLANTEVLTDISEQVNRLRNEMQRAEFEASQTRLQIVDKLDKGIKEHKVDQGFANDMLREIARAVGVRLEPSEINKELASFRREKVEAAAHKNRAEEYFLQQVIELLSQAEAAKDQEEIKKHYFLRVRAIEKLIDEIRPLQSFYCPIERKVMVNPVSLCTGTTCERAAIEVWFERGKKVDPNTGDLLDDFSLRENHRLRQSIEEWRELNYCVKIRSAKRKLQSEMDSVVEEALVQMQEIVTENPINKDWIFIEGLIELCLSSLGSSHNKNIKRRVLILLKATVEGHYTNKEKLIEFQGINYIVPCLGRSSDVSKAAVELLFDLLQDRNGWNLYASRKLSEQRSAFLFLVLLMNKQSVEKAKTILLKLCNDDDDNIIQAAKANWYKPLIDRLVQGPESSRISMAKALVQIELVDQSLKCLGEVGAIPPLLKMVSGNFESKELALSALVKLSTCSENKKLIAAAGGVPLILETLFSHVRTIIIARCCEILERLSSNDDGIEFFIGEDGCVLELDKIVTKLLAFHQNTNLSIDVRKPALRTLLGICKSQESNVVKAVVSANGVSIILPLLDVPDLEIQEVSINLLFHFSRHEPQGIVQFLLLNRRLDNLLDILTDDNRRNAQMAAVGLLANLPKSETELTKKLIESDGLPAILNILSSGTMEAKENALNLLFRFTDPTNLESQRLVVELGIYPLLVSFLKSGTVTAKARAAALIGNLSLSSHELTATSKPTSSWPFRKKHTPTCEAHTAALIGNLSLSSHELTATSKPTSSWPFRKKHTPTCEAHGVICSVTSTFCILEANALPELVKLLHEKVDATTYEALQALFTLVCQDRYHRGPNVLHVANAISPILEVLNWGEPSLKEEALGILEKVFISGEMVELYGARARLHLVGLTTRNIHEDDRLRRKAARVLTLLESNSRTSMLLV